MKPITIKQNNEGIERQLVIGNDFIFYSGLAKDFKQKHFEFNIIQKEVKQ